ncbi:tape measure protein [Morganella morganii]|uniref:tape measure protein n=2 Tax=Morganella TaxID=581 RepID=UPI000CE2920C|nr:tape measure protein [Morganella morganii]AVD60393.1 tape measure protein [Morganella morganii]MBT0430162.1 tape measure protein [Morganella morganii subsp. morganii]MBT0524879.1 tape measure protein [Morganella morganii subsp. morganii]QWM17282.1 tape measure protein [Morganella morganii subsp. morganii]
MAQVGEIVYQVQMDVAQLLTSQRQLDQRLRNMEGGFNRTTTSVNGTERSMAALSRVAASLTAYLSVSAVTSYAEAWTVLNNKLVNSIKAGETLAVVNQRVFDIAQNSRSSLDSIATLYSRLERAMRSAGLSGEELGQITTTISKAMTVSGATAAESEGALVQLSQALASGVLRGQEFNSMSEQAPALMKGLADSLGVSIGKLRAMAAEGKLTTDVLLKAFREMGPAIEKEFANTTQTMSQSLQIASNNITKFFGENTTVKTFINIFNDATVSASNNLESLTNVLLIAAGVMGSRYVGALTLSATAQAKKVKETLADMAATKQAVRVEIEAATATINRIAAEKTLAVTVQQSLGAQLAAATTEAQRTRIRRELAVNSAVITGLTQQETAATNSLAAAQNRLNVASGLASKALSLIGGPVGAAMLAGAAVYYFFQKAEEAKRSAQEFADSLNELRASMDKMSRTELAAKIADARDELEVLTDAQRSAEQEVKNLKTAYKAYSDGVLHFGSTQENLEIISRKLAKAEANLERVQNDRSKTVNFISAAQAKLNGELLQGEELLKREASTLLPNAGAALRAYGLDLDGATKAKQKFNSASLKVEWSDAGADMKKTLEREIEMAGAKDDVVRRQLQVKYYVEDKGISEQEAKKLAELAAKAGEASEAKKTGIKISREAVSEAKKEATEAEKFKQKITDLANATKVAELETKGLSREAAILEAVQKLGSKANSAQIAEVTALAGKEYDLTQKIKDRKEAFEQNPQAKVDQDIKHAGEQLERQLKGNLITEEQYQKRSIELKAEHARKTAEINAKSAVTPVQDMVAQVDPVQALANEHAQKLALIKDFENQKVITAQQSLALINAANTEYEEARLNAQWEIWRNQSQANQFLADGLDALGQRSSNVLTGLITGAQSLNDAFRNVASTIVDEAVGALVQMGMQQIKNMVVGEAMSTAAQASTVAQAVAVQSAWAPAAMSVAIATMGAAVTAGSASYMSAMAASKTMAVAGARYNGGPVDANKMYRVGENGQPEIFKASNGHQYMIPGDSGKVISNRQMGGDGGVSMGDMYFNFQVQAPNGMTEKEATMITRMVKGTVYDVLMTEIRSGAIQGNQRY